MYTTWSPCTPYMIFMYTTWSLCTPHDLYVHHTIIKTSTYHAYICYILCDGARKTWLRYKTLNSNPLHLWMLPKQQFSFWLFQNHVFTSYSSVIQVAFFSTSSHQNQKIPAHVCVFHVSSSWILPCCCFTGIVPQPKQWSFFLMPMSEARSRFQLFCLFVCLCHFSKSRHFGAK